ncbi:MAG: UDP-N-acetylmuramoyl-L-alanine--D-glutamate ligase, partial [Lachnospiraceae bacterium]|nr:UDP-N-acetylmuramoyl-L-alanine--D-glutamate ligase [Lachnospiraceae bacterium]
HIAVFLNLFEEHLDYYKTMDKYFLAKTHIGSNQKAGDFLLLGENVPGFASPAEKIVIKEAEASRVKLKVPGRHNEVNANFVLKIACDLLGCNREKALESLEKFEGLDHRLQFVGEKNGILFYDDSISTIPQATIMAANSIKNVKTILVGGMDRGIDYSLLVSFIRDRSDINFIFMYDSGKRIFEEAMRPSNGFYVRDLKEGVQLSKDITGKGEVCLLSPAAPSYGFFKNFEERGTAFKTFAMED